MIESVKCESYSEKERRKKEVVEKDRRNEERTRIVNRKKSSGWYHMERWREGEEGEIGEEKDEE